MSEKKEINRMYKEPKPGLYLIVDSSSEAYVLKIGRRNKSQRLWTLWDYALQNAPMIKDNTVKKWISNRIKKNEIRPYQKAYQFKGKLNLLDLQ